MQINLMTIIPLRKLLVYFSPIVMLLFHGRCEGASHDHVITTLSDQVRMST